MNDLERFISIVKTQLGFYIKMLENGRFIVTYLNNAEKYLNNAKKEFDSNKERYKQYGVEIVILSKKIDEAKSKIEK